MAMSTTTTNLTSLQNMGELSFTTSDNKTKRACNACRQRKIKCTPIPSSTSCSSCTKKNVACIYSDNRLPVTRRINRLPTATTINPHSHLGSQISIDSTLFINNTPPALVNSSTMIKSTSQTTSPLPTDFHPKDSRLGLTEPPVEETLHALDGLFSFRSLGWSLDKRYITFINEFFYLHGLSNSILDHDSLVALLLAPTKPPALDGLLLALTAHVLRRQSPHDPAIQDYHHHAKEAISFLPSHDPTLGTIYSLLLSDLQPTLPSPPSY